MEKDPMHTKEQHEGERYLAMIGLENVADVDIQTPEGETIKARDFLDICGEHAKPMLETFAQMDEAHPQYEATRQALKSVVMGYIPREDNS